MKAVIKNLPGSGNLSDFQIIIPNKIGGSTVAKYKNAGSLIIINLEIYLRNYFKIFNSYMIKNINPQLF